MVTKMEKSDTRIMMKEKLSLFANKYRTEKRIADEEICSKIIRKVSSSNHSLCMVYIALDTEVNIKDAILAIGKSGIRICAPRISGETMDFFAINSYNDLTKGTYGIYEPSDYCQKVIPHDAICLVPAYAFGKEGERLGKGGGYYDRYFANHTDIYKIGIGYQFQCNKIFPTEPTDITMDEIICNDMRYEI